MHPAPGVRSLLACYERAISENEKAGVTSRMFLNNIAKQPSSGASRTRPRETPTRSEAKGLPRHASVSASHPKAKATSPVSAAVKSSRLQLTRSSSERNVRSNAARCTTTTSALEHRLGKHGALASTRFGKSDTTISTAGSSVPDEVEEPSWSLAGGNFGLDEGSDDDDHKACTLYPFKQRRSAPPAVGLPERLAAFQPETTIVPLSLRSFHRSSSSRSLRSSSDDDECNGFKVLVHRPTDGVDDDASPPAQTGAKHLERPHGRTGESPRTRDSTLTKQSSSRSLRSTTARKCANEELDGASCHSVRDRRSMRAKSQRSSPTIERNATVEPATSEVDPQSSSSSTSARRSLASTSTSREEKSAGRDSERMGDLDSSSRHSVASHRSRRSRPTSTTGALKGSGTTDVPHKERSTCSVTKLAKEKSKPPQMEPTIDTGSEPSSKAKYARIEPKVSSGRSSTHSKRIASSDFSKESDSGLGKSSAPSRRAGGTGRSASTERCVAPATKVEASPSSPTTSHHGSWTLALDDSGTEIDISPGSTARSPKVSSGCIVAPKAKASSAKRPATKVRRKEPGTRRSSSAKACTSGSTSPSSKSGSKVKAALSRSRVRGAECPSLSPTAAVTAQPKTSSLERRRQRHLERIAGEQCD